MHVVFFGRSKLAFTEVHWVVFGLLEQFKCIGISFFGHCLSCKFGDADEELTCDLAFAAFPRMVVASVYQRECLIGFTQLVVECYALDAEVITLLNLLCMAFEELQSLAVRYVKLLVELIEFHEDAGVCCIQCVGFFDGIFCLGCIALFVVVCKCKVAQNCRECIVD